MAATLDTIEQNLKDIKDSVGGFKNSNDDFSDKLSDVVNKLNAINGNISTIDSSVQNLLNGGQAKSSTGTNIEQIVSQINTQLEKINLASRFAAFGNIAKSLSNIDKNINGVGDVLRKAIEDNGRHLDAINRNLGSYINSLQNKPSNASNSPSVSSNTTDIETKLDKIISHLSGIHSGLINKGVFKTDNKELNEKLQNNLDLKAEFEAERLEREKELNKYFKTITSTASTKEEKLSAETEYIKILKKQNQEKKDKEKLEKRANGGIGGTIGKGLGGVSSFLSGGKPSSSDLMNKGISAISNIPIWGGLASGIMQVFKGLFDLGAVRDKAATNYARVIGGNNNTKVNIGETVNNLNGGLDFSKQGFFGGYRAEDAYSALTEMAAARGRTIERQSQQSIRSLIDLNRFGIGVDAISNFDTFGKSVEQTDKYFARLYNEVSKKGLAFKTVSKAVNDNLRNAQKYTFADGLRGLERMAEKSTQLKYNMQQVFQFADKVSEVEGAISTAANLSVLGGSFGQFSNPMQLLYEGLNDVGALQDRIQNMFTGKAFYNEETKQIDMSSMDREFLKQASKAAGFDSGEMLNMAYNDARLKRIENQIQPGLSKETVEYIKNIADLDQNGNGIVTINGKDKLVAELSEEDRDMLQKESLKKDRGDNAHLGDVYRLTSNISEQMDNILSFLQEKLGAWVHSIFLSIGRREGGRQESAMGNTNDEELKRRRLEFYNETSINKNAFFGERGRYARAIGRGEYDSQLPKAAGGINPSKLVPGNNGILIGDSHLKGGIKGINQGTPWEAEGGEFLINKVSSKRYRKELYQIQNGTFNPYSYTNELIKNNMQEYFKPIKVQANTPNQGATTHDLRGNVKIDIPQSISLNLTGVGNIGESNQLPQLIAKYVAEYVKQMDIWKNFGRGYDKENFPNKFYTTA